MARTLSLIVLVALVLLVGALFVAVMRQFLLPLFLALLLVVMFRPLHQWFLRKLPRSPRIAAALTTLAIITIVLAPLLIIFYRAGIEAATVASSADPEALAKQFQERGSHVIGKIRDKAHPLGIEIPTDGDLVKTAADTLKSWLAPAALSTTHFVFSFLFGLIIMLIALYFFLADGPDMIDTIVKLTPLDAEHVQQMLTEFDCVSRAVVVATLASAVVQGALAGFAYFLAGLPHFFLLTAATTLLTMVPFVGATAIWLPCSIWLYLQGRTLAAVLLAIWGILVVSVADNVVKPYVLRGQSNLHPLLALLSVIGGMEALGPIGIFVGPMVVTFLYALLVMLRAEIQKCDTPNGQKNLQNPLA
jgi:predicted PurR-regulated permease PerM